MDILTHVYLHPRAHTYTIQIKVRESWALPFKADFCSLQILLFLKNHPEQFNDLLPQSLTLQAAFCFFLPKRSVHVYLSVPFTSPCELPEERGLRDH